MVSKPDWSTQSARLRWARLSAGYPSARGVALQRGWPIATYQTHEDGSRLKKGLSEDDARKYARAFRVDLAWLMTGVGEPRRKPDAEGEVTAIVQGRIGAGALVIEEKGEAGGWPIDGIPREIAETCELWEVEGESMLPLFHDRDILAIERRYTSPGNLVGRLALVKLATGERLIKTLKRGPEGLYNLVSLNAEDRDEVEVVAAGRLAWAKFA
jgi:phage repressor protein C with HTH and peptisase S24 domain